MKLKTINRITKPMSGTVQVPGSKSVTNRALLLAALTDSTVVLQNPLESDDTKSMIDCLAKLGINISKSADTLTISGNLINIPNKSYELNAGLSGTTLRFLLPILCVIPGEKIIQGEDGLNRRPVKDLVDSLKNMGADISYLDKEGYPPLQIKQSVLRGNQVKISGKISSQYVSALLMMLPMINGGTVKIKNKLVSQSYVDLTIQTMQDFGVNVYNKDYSVFTVKSQQAYQRTTPLKIEGDISSACYFAAYAALTSSSLRIDNINSQSIQGDRKFFKILKDMGNLIIEHKNGITIHGKQVKAVTVDMESCPDQIQTLAVIAAFANGVTTVSGTQTLTVKETDRVKATQNELKKMGIKTTATKNTLTIYGGVPKSAEIETYGDHRMAMSFALAGLKLPDLKIKNPEVVSKTFPDFWRNLEKIGV